MDNWENDAFRKVNSAAPAAPRKRTDLVAIMAESIRIGTHALFAPIPRRAARTPAGLGGGRPAREAQEGRARMEGAFALQQGEDALVLRQRPEDGVVRLLLRQERQHLRLRDADRGALVPRGGRAAGGASRRPAAAGVARRRGARAAPPTLADIVELAAQFFEATLASRARRQRRAAISPTAGSIRRPSSSSASATLRPSASRSRSTWATKGYRPRT